MHTRVMSWKASMRAVAATEKRQQREAKKRQRDLENRAKEMAKLSALEQARLEVETYENELDVLLSIHKDQSDPWDWAAIIAYLPPVPPSRQPYNEFKARQRLAVSPSQHETSTLIQQAQQQDEREYQDAMQTYSADHAEWEKLSRLARRILDGEHAAYLQAIQEFIPFAELSGIGSSMNFTVHNTRILECVFSINGRQAIPSEVKSLTASGKVSVKPMPKQRFIEIYQDYVCGCVLRVAREAFALLPLDTILITVLTDALDTRTGQAGKQPFLSVVIPQATLNTFNFERLDPSDTVLSMIHHGDLKASRKTGDFDSIIPLNMSDIAQEPDQDTDINSILVSAQRLRSELSKQCAALSPELQTALQENGEK